jgi:hypothetical protein
MFTIDKDTGEIFLFDYILDYEKKHEYKIIVEAKDYGGIETNNWPSLSSYINVIITVEDVNDEKPEIIFIIPDEDKIRIMNISKPELNKGLLKNVLFLHSVHRANVPMVNLRKMRIWPY